MKVTTVMQHRSHVSLHCAAFRCCRLSSGCSAPVWASLPSPGNQVTGAAKSGSHVSGTHRWPLCGRTKWVSSPQVSSGAGPLSTGCGTRSRFDTSRMSSATCRRSAVKGNGTEYNAAVCRSISPGQDHFHKWVHPLPSHGPTAPVGPTLCRGVIGSSALQSFNPWPEDADHMSPGGS